MKIKHITSIIESIAPLSYQESYDNAGLQVGNPQSEVDAVLICVDVTEAVVDEAIAKGCGLIISHHPLIFGGLKRLTGATCVERSVVKAITNNIAIYSAHTNIDTVRGGVNSMICNKIGLLHTRPLAPAKGDLVKIVTFVPTNYASPVLQAMFAAGAGSIGNYDSCSFSTSGTGSFRGNDLTHPFVGQTGNFHQECEVKLETIAPAHLQHNVVKALKEVHPYEEVAYDLVKLENTNPNAGAGMVGELATPENELDFLVRIKDVFGCQHLRHSPLLGNPIKRVAVCGGSGSFLIKNALSAHADIFITADIKYHDFFIPDNQIIVVDIGHYESEKFTKELFCDILREKNTNFAVHLTGINTNPINYL